MGPDTNEAPQHRERVTGCQRRFIATTSTAARGPDGVNAKAVVAIPDGVARMPHSRPLSPRHPSSCLSMTTSRARRRRVVDGGDAPGAAIGRTRPRWDTIPFGFFLGLGA